MHEITDKWNVFMEKLVMKCMNKDDFITKFNVFKWVCDRYVEWIR